jgi:hypothetical protein
MEEWDSGEGRRLENELATPAILVLLHAVTKNKYCLALDRELHARTE